MGSALRSSNFVMSEYGSGGRRGTRAAWGMGWVDFVFLGPMLATLLAVLVLWESDGFVGTRKLFVNVTFAISYVCIIALRLGMRAFAHCRASRRFAKYLANDAPQQVVLFHSPADPIGAAVFYRDDLICFGDKQFVEQPERVETQLEEKSDGWLLKINIEYSDCMKGWTETFPLESDQHEIVHRWISSDPQRMVLFGLCDKLSGHIGLLGHADLG